MAEKIRIPHLGILVTTYCNLNCRNCADLIPKRERKHYEAKAVKKDLNRILSVVEFIEEVLVIGGETILYPELTEVLSFCAQQSKIGKIIITTNGKIVPDKDILDCLRYNKVLVRISGYPDYVVPNRKTVVKKYRDCGIDIEDFENMKWFSMGDFQKRRRSEKELQMVFQTCSMKDCVSVNAEGKIFYCSRQMSAMELPEYPEPMKNEYVDVRNTTNLGKRLKEFYELSYISTCDFCDGISCMTSKAVITATQILDKAAFLDGIASYEILISANTETEKREAVDIVFRILHDFTEKLCDFKEAVELAEALQSFTNNCEEEYYSLLADRLKKLLDKLAYDYTYIVSKNVPYALSCHMCNTPNQITVGMYPVDTDCDLLLTEDDILKALGEKYPVDGIMYNKLFIDSKLKRLEKETMDCIVSGLSYTQYGILENKMPFSTVNLSVTGEDTPYSILMAEYALKLNPGVKYIIIPMTYYQGCYDMSNDEIVLHKNVVSGINLPILKNARNYKGTLRNKDGYITGMPLKIYEMVFDLYAARIERDKAITDRLSQMEYFNEMNPQNSFGGLRYNFQELESRDKKFELAKITAEHNERICTNEGYLEVKKYLEPFLEKMKKQGKKVVIFVPPMTEYLYESYHKELKDFFYDRIVSVLEHYNNVIFRDWAKDGAFLETDFCDFEHLNDRGAEKLTKMIANTLMK